MYDESSSLPANSQEEEIARAAESLRAKLVEQRRDFHMNPELSNRAERTSRVIAERMRELGLDEVRTGVGKYGVVALHKGKLPGSVMAVRADMDALPIQETFIHRISRATTARRRQDDVECLLDCLDRTATGN
ncbi:MAG: hypothetical protein J2P21_19325 [Chloracidobacterium sp.]|nr:hypothetical protein [Chloracidobacterium sp.]